MYLLYLKANHMSLQVHVIYIHMYKSSNDWYFAGQYSTFHYQDD